MLAVDIVVLAQQLQEFKRTLICSDAYFGVDLFIGSLRLEHVLPMNVFFSSIVEIPVIDGSDGEGIMQVRLFSGGLFDVFDDELT